MKRLKTYVVENPLDHDRFLGAKERLENVGFEVLPTVVPWDDPELLEHLKSKTRSNKPHSFYVAVISNSLAHSRAWERIATDVSLENGDWSLVVEDDVRFNPAIPQSEIQGLVKVFLEASHATGFAYLGICAVGFFGEAKQLPRFTSILTKRAFGPFAHAYAVEKKFAKDFHNQILDMCGGSGKLYSRPLDRHLCKYWRKNGGAPLCGVNISSPIHCNTDHLGIMYQDRASFKSSFERYREKQNSVSHHRARTNTRRVAYCYREVRQVVGTLSHRIRKWLL
ncbi:MAG: hypothetical protein JRH01_16255 [Deltaproteobacteria bacterium]|nr:hypothetical protein [Deltaproteobacteria bacterium]MBW2401880.1 hypothetical protein [Deltaproteobacteria bacterium]